MNLGVSKTAVQFFDQAINKIGRDVINEIQNSDLEKDQICTYLKEIFSNSIKIKPQIVPSYSKIGEKYLYYFNILDLYKLYSPNFKKFDQICGKYRAFFDGTFYDGSDSTFMAIYADEFTLVNPIGN